MKYCVPYLTITYFSQKFNRNLKKVSKNAKKRKNGGGYNLQNIKKLPVSEKFGFPRKGKQSNHIPENP